MNKESILYGVIGVLGGSLLTIFIATTSVNAGNSGMMRMMGMNTNQFSTNMTDRSMGMDTMTDSLKSKTGDSFDRAFISQMIVHHEGAIAMAKLAGQNAKHDEVKKLATEIVEAQTREITQMTQWQKDWGYPTDDNSMGGMH